MRAISSFSRGGSMRGMASLGAVIVAAALLVSGCNGRSEIQKSQQGQLSKKDKKKGYLASINLSAGAPEAPMSDGFFPQPFRDSYAYLIRTLERLRKDDSLKGVLVRVRSQTIPFAQADELSSALSDLRAKNIPVVCHAHDVDNATYWFLRRGCSQLWVSAAGSVPTVGIGAELSFLKGAFDKVGIRFDMLAMGKYKSGGEALTRSEPTETSLANLTNTLRDLREQWLNGLSQGQRDADKLKQLVEDGPWSPKKAQEIGLIEHVGYEDEARESLESLAKVSQIEHVFGPGSEQPTESPVADLVRLLAGAQQREKQKERIALVPAVGSITMSAEGPFGGGSGITASAMVRTLRRLREDDKVRAIVMRMDSPGGSPLASDLIWREMMLTREKKPVIVSIAGMSASGGYYIACGATKIIASPTAIVGSIGVFGGKVVLQGAAEKLGVNNVLVPASPNEGAGPRAAHMSPFTPWDDATRERVRESMQRIYDLFVERVAEGRDMKPEAVYATAEGEIFLSKVGKERGLIDEIGGLAYALSVARKEAGLAESTPVVLEGTEETLFESLFLGPEPEAQEIQAAINRFEQARVRAAGRWALGDAFASLSRYQAALSPMFAGESVVAALPYQIEIR